MKRKYVGSIFLAAMACCIALDLPAQTLRIGAVAGERGKTVSVPVTLTATTSHTAALVRVQYNTAVLENVAATAGPLMSSGHALDSYAPAAGRFDVAVYAPSGKPSFKAKSGTLFNLTFRVKSNAPSGVWPITFTTVGTPSLPSADLVGVTGAAVTPTATAGSVQVVATDASPVWSLYP
jgi:hypothetical protein